MNGMPSAEVISFRRPATSICNCSDSTTQGPEMRKKGWSMPTLKPHNFMLDSSRRHLALLTLALVLERLLDVRLEQRMPAPRRGLELGVELHAHEPRVHAARQLHDLGELLALGEGGDHQARLAQLVEVVHVGFVAVAVALGH